MKKEDVNVMGMPLERWTNGSCVADFGVGDDWATLYSIETPQADRKKGLATNLLIEARKYYEEQGKNFGGSIALSPEMKKIYGKLNITEYA